MIVLQIYAMLKRFIEQQKAICAVFLEDRDARQFMLSDDEISVAEEHLDTMIRLKEAFYLDPWLKLCISR